MNRWASGAPPASSARHLGRFGLQPVWIDDPRHEPDREGFVGFDDPTGQRKVACTGEADKPRQEPRAAEVECQSSLDEDLGEPCSAAGDHDVTTEGEVHAGTDGNSIDGSDRRLRYPVERERGPVRETHVLGVCRRRPESREVGAEIGTGTEFTAGPGDHQRPLV